MVYATENESIAQEFEITINPSFIKSTITVYKRQLLRLISNKTQLVFVILMPLMWLGIIGTSMTNLVPASTLNGQDFIIVELADNSKIEKAISRVSSLDFVQSTKVESNKIFISLKQASKFLAPIVQTISGNNNGESYIAISSIESKKPTLNDVFLYFTGKELRDEEADLSDRLKMAGRKGGRGFGMMRRHKGVITYGICN